MASESSRTTDYCRPSVSLMRKAAAALRSLVLENEGLRELMNLGEAHMAAQEQRIRELEAELGKIADFIEQNASNKTIEEWKPQWRHKKREKEYMEIGRAQLQVDPGKVLADYDELVVYRAEDGALWVRPTGEFMDGRFDAIRALATGETKE